MPRTSLVYELTHGSAIITISEIDIIAKRPIKISYPMLFSSLSGLVSFILIPLNKLELSAGLVAHVRLRLHSGHQVTTPFLLTNSLGYISFGVCLNVCSPEC